MNIPDKYRDRYDRLAASHPWMREMRDEPELTVYNEASDDELFRCSYCHCKVYNIDMTEGDCGWGFTFCPQCGGEVYESDSRKIEAKLGEPTNGIGGETNGIEDGSPLVDRDPVGIMRSCSDMEHGMGLLRKVLGIECVSGWQMRCLKVLADMVERDYVSRQDFAAQHRTLCAVREQRDELKKRVDEQQETLDADCRDLIEYDNEICKLTAERDELQTMNEKLQVALDAVEGCDERCLKLEAERDEWKANAEQAEHAMNKAAGKWAKADDENRELRKILLLDDGTVEEYTERADPLTALAYQRQLAEEWRDRCHNAEAWCDKLESERDEWKAKAEAKSAKRAAAAERVRKAKDAGTSIGYAIVGCEYYPWEAYEALIDLLTDEPMDAHRDINGTCLDGNGTASNISENLEQSQDSEIDEPDTVRNELEDNGYVVMPYHNGEKQAKLRGKQFDQVIFDELHDSREKLEADALSFANGFIRDHNGAISWNDELYRGIVELLDRQAAITERECRHENYAEGDVYRKVYTKSHIDEMIRDAKIELELQRDRNAELQEALDQQRAATANANDLRGRTRDELAAVKAEREAYRSLFGKSLDLADEIRALGADCDTGVAR